MKYIVMECHPGYCVLMGEDSGFVKAADLHYTVGQTVERPILLQYDNKPSVTVSHRVRKWVMTAAACLLIFAGFGAYIYNTNYSAYSSIIISAEAEIRIDVNSKGKVISVVPLNELGEKVLEGYDLEKGQSEADVAELLMKRYVKLGLINSGDTVEFVIDAPDKEIYDDYSSDMKAVANKQSSLSIKTSIRKYEDKEDAPVNAARPDAPVDTAPVSTTAVTKRTEAAGTKHTAAAKIQPPSVTTQHRENRITPPPAERVQPPVVTAPVPNEAPKQSVPLPNITPKQSAPVPNVAPKQSVPVPNIIPKQSAPDPNDKTLPDTPQRIRPGRQEDQKTNENKNNNSNKNKENIPKDDSSRIGLPDDNRPAQERIPNRPSEDITKPDNKQNEKAQNDNKPNDKLQNDNKPGDKPQNDNKPNDKPQSDNKPSDKPQNDNKPNDKPQNDNKPNDKPQNDNKPNDKLQNDNNNNEDRQGAEEHPKPTPSPEAHEPSQQAPHPEQGRLPHQQNGNTAEASTEPLAETEK